MARYLLGIKITLTRDEKEAAEILRPLVRQKLQLGRKGGKAGHRPGGSREEKKSFAGARSRFAATEITSLLNRINKLKEGIG